MLNKYIGDVWSICCVIYVEMYLNKRFKCFLEFICFIWSSKILVVLFQRPTLPNSMISGFVGQGPYLFTHLHLPKYFKKYKKHVGNFSKHIICATPIICKCENTGNTCFVCSFLEDSGTSFDQFWQRRAPKYDEEPRKRVFEIIDMTSISVN